MIKRSQFLIMLLSLIFCIGIYCSFSSSISTHPHATSVLNVYTWLDFIPPTLQKKFEQETGIKLHIDYIDSDEGLEAKLLTGKSGYDIVYPSTPHVFRHIQLKLYQPINLDKVPNIANIDHTFINDYKVDAHIYSVPYLWGSSGFAYDANVLNAIFPGELIDSWGYMFDPIKLKKIAGNGVASTSSGNELFCAIGFWQGYSPQENTLERVNVATNYANQARSYWRVFLSSESAIQALGAGEVAIAFTWNGDAIAAQTLGKLSGKDIRYVIPNEGALKWVDGLAIPSNATNSDGAHQFINFLLDPENAAAVTNYVKFANTCAGSKKFIHSEIIANQAIYPDDRVTSKLILDKRTDHEFERTINRHFFKILVGY